MKIQNQTFRILAGFIMVASIIWGYWWLTWTLAIIFLFIFPLYYEIIFWGVMYDALYGLSIPQFYNFRYIFTVVTLLLFILSFFLRKSLLAYEDTF